MKRRAVVWLIPTLLTVHNAEEALAFRRFLPGTRSLLSDVFPAFADGLNYEALVAALAVLSLLAFALALLVELRPRSTRLLWMLLVLEAAVTLNAVSHVVTAMFVFGGYAPGLVTAVLINAPFAVYCFARASGERWVSPAALRATVPAALVLHGPVLIGGLWLAMYVGK